MHRLPRFFGHSKQAEGMDQKIRRKPKLERRNAAKFFEYDAASSSSSLDDSCGSLYTRSMDCYDRTSFRIEGVDGEFDLICRSLGLSGPEDFAIPPAAWEAMRVRSSSDILPRLKLNELESQEKEELKNEESNQLVREADDKCEERVTIRDVTESAKDEPAETSGSGGIKGEFDLICRSLGLSGPEDFAIPPAAWEARKVRSSSDILPRLKLNELESQEKEELKNEESNQLVREADDKCEERVTIRDVTESAKNEPAEISGSGGIKGLRPRMIKPPPGMRLPVIDNMCSTWDLLRDFAPQGERQSLEKYEEPNFSDDAQERHRETGRAEEQKQEEAGEHGVDGFTPKLEEDNASRLANAVAEFSGCSFTTSNEDDSSSSSTGPRSTNISPNVRFRRIIANWQKGELLGRGSFGSVYEGISGDGFFFAVKEVSLLDPGSQGQQSVFQLEQEIALLSQFEHENIVQYYGTETDESKLYIFLELVTKGSLASLYRRYNLRDSQVSAYTRQILHGLKYLHDQNVIHRDIKCANILVDASGSVKLADFGLAKATKLNDIKSCKGTAFWMAPEVVKGKNQGYGLPADIWSLGCTVLEMLTGQIPYSNLEGMQALYRIGKGERPPVPESLSKDARAFILQCLQVNPDDRPTATKLLNHPFVQRPLSISSGSASPYIPGRRNQLVSSN